VTVPVTKSLPENPGDVGVAWRLCNAQSRLVECRHRRGVLCTALKPKSPLCALLFLMVMGDVCTYSLPQPPPGFRFRFPLLSSIPIAYLQQHGGTIRTTYQYLFYTRTLAAEAFSQ